MEEIKTVTFYLFTVILYHENTGGGFHQNHLRGIQVHAPCPQVQKLVQKRPQENSCQYGKGSQKIASQGKSKGKGGQEKAEGGRSQRDWTVEKGERTGKVKIKGEKKEIKGRKIKRKREGKTEREK